MTDITPTTSTVIPTAFASAPGGKTSEFKMTVLTNLIAAVVAFVSVIHPGFSVSTTAQATVAGAAMVVIAWVTSVFAHGRSQIKVAQFGGSTGLYGSPTTVPPGPTDAGMEK